jgi:hypothetical protein
MDLNVPRMSDDTVDTVLDTALDTAYDDPIAGTEIEMLLFALERSRAQFAWKVGGLDAAALSTPHPPSAMTLGGLLKHLALVEDQRTSVDLTGAPMGAPWERSNFEGDPDWDWNSAADDSPEYLYSLWRGAVERSRAAWAEVLAKGGLDQPSRFTTESGESPDLRRILIDAHDEYARHVGHADLFREAVDGLVGEDPPQPR